MFETGVSAQSHKQHGHHASAISSYTLDEQKVSKQQLIKVSLHRLYIWRFTACFFDKKSIDLNQWFKSHWFKSANPDLIICQQLCTGSSTQEKGTEIVWPTAGTAHHLGLTDSQKKTKQWNFSLMVHMVQNFEKATSDETKLCISDLPPARNF